MTNRRRGAASLGIAAAVALAACHGGARVKASAAGPVSSGTAPVSNAAVSGPASSDAGQSAASAPVVAARSTAAASNGAPVRLQGSREAGASPAVGAKPGATATVDHPPPASTAAPTPVPNAAPSPAAVSTPAPTPPAASTPAPRAATADSTPAVSAATIAAGRGIFHGSGTCFACHGAALEGGPIAPTLRAHDWKDARGGTLEAIYAVVTHGVPNTAMVAHPGGISDADARQVAGYVWAVSQGRAQP